MFEIRVICDLDDTERVVAALDHTFTTGTVTVYPTRDGKRSRFYVRADHTPTNDTGNAKTDWPTPEAAYANAPSANDEMAWLLGHPYGRRGREWWLRRAAVNDRMVLGMTPRYTSSEANALDLAHRLIEMDNASVTGDPRAYVRQQYARWANSH
ncbi:hypothetical protein [Streptomyces mirabilis]|uniref:Uncharacterized protein n=1 Tax=Streptomyces mirabilis TaxID=68239 RepID=A0ABU3UQF0_9ACTN|nr:hypothetical protein [Streptomyces mirabilis]MDU8996157.1 hypothetical protein [Streptomyces mirabilis]